MNPTQFKQNMDSMDWLLSIFHLAMTREAFISGKPLDEKKGPSSPKDLIPFKESQDIHTTVLAK